MLLKGLVIDLSTLALPWTPTKPCWLPPAARVYLHQFTTLQEMFALGYA